MAFDTPLPMHQRVPMSMIPFDRRWEQIPPWEEQPLVQDPNDYKPSLFWKDQQRRIEETTPWPNAPWWVQGSADWLKEQVIGSKISQAEKDERFLAGVKGLAESKKEREARLAAERKKAAAEKQELAQAQRRMPTAVPSIPKIEEEEDFMDGMLKYMLVSHLLGGTAADEYSGTSTVSIGQARDWPTMTPMV